MNSAGVHSIIIDYVRANLSPREPERKMIAARYDQLQKMLGGRSFLNGSYARHTSTTPVNDLDIFWILPDSVRRLIIEKRIKPEDLTIENILQDLATALQKEYGGEAKVVVQPHSVGVYFGAKDEFSIDVVPAQPTEGSLFLVPETALRSVRARRLIYESRSVPKLRWIKSDPKGYIDQATSLDQRTSGVFRKAAKFVKKWKRGCKSADDTFPLKSFHVEIVVTEFLKSNPSLSCFEAIRKFYATLPTLFAKPQYPDRADSSRFIDDYVRSLSDGERSLVTAEHERVTQLLNRLGTEIPESEVIRIIEDILRLTATRNQSPAIAGAPFVPRSPWSYGPA